jgi:hypothetical protein
MAELAVIDATARWQHDSDVLKGAQILLQFEKGAENVG